MFNIKTGSNKGILLLYVVGFVGIFVCTVGFFIGIWHNYISIPTNKKKIKENLQVANGAIITKIKSVAKVSDLHTFTYSYFVGEQKQIQSCNIGMNFKSNASNYLMERSLPVAYEKGNPENSRLLIVPKDFEYFEILFPDSLKWIKNDITK